MSVVSLSAHRRTRFNRASLGGDDGIEIPSLITIVNTTQASNNNNFTIAYPGGWEDQDVGYLFVTAGNALLTSITAGWTQISSNTASLSVGYIYRRVLVPGDTDPVSLQFDTVTGHGALFVVLRGMDLTAFEDVAIINQGNNFSSTVPGTTVSPVTDSAALFTFARRGNSNNPPTMVATNNFQEVVAGFACGSNAAMTVAQNKPVLIGNYTTPSWSFQSGFSAVDHLVIRPRPAGNEKFLYTGAYQEYVVGPSTTDIRVIADGAEGGTEYALSTAGKGARVICDVAVTPAEVLRVYVGGTGQDAPIISTNPTTGGFNGGGDGRNGAGAGGGATDIRRAPYALADRLVVAGGGGGSGCNNGPGTGAGGNGHTPTGVNGGNGLSGPTGGGGGGSGAGGAAGTGVSNGTAGALGTGGNGGSDTRGGGGGGGGHYGGGGGGSSGGGTAGGGGGGGSGLSTGVNETLTSGHRSGNGLLQIEAL